MSTFTVERGGPEPTRVLLIGDEHALVSADDPEVRLAEHLADEVAVRTGRGIRLDTVWDLAPVLRAMQGASRTAGDRHYDAVVVLVHDVPSRTSHVTAMLLRRLLQRVLHELALTSVVELVLLDPPTRDLVDRATRRFHQQVLAGFAGSGSGVTSISVPSGLVDVAGDAAAVAESLVPLLPVETAGTSGIGSAGETRTEDAVVAASPGLRRLVVLARNSFQVPFVEVLLLTGRTAIVVARAGEPPPHVRRLLRGMEGPAMLVPDAQRAPAASAQADGDDPVRFFAAHLVESPAGEPIGVIALADVVPHEVLEGDEALLLDLALLAGAELTAIPRDD